MISVSVIIPAHNAGPFLQRCLDSVYAQTVSASEIIVIDDGSTDDTASILRRQGSAIHTLSQSNQGRSAARNAGIKTARADYVAFLDADDEYLPDHLAQLIAEAEKTHADIVYDCIGDPYFTDKDRLPAKPEQDHAIQHVANYQLWIINAMARREFIQQTGVSFVPELSIAEDALFFWMLIAYGASVRYVRKRGTRVGIHGSNTTADLVKTSEAATAAYQHFEVFLRDTPLKINKRRWLREAERGRNSNLLMADLYRLYLDEARFSSIARSRLLHHMLSRDPFRPVDRIRCLLALVWLWTNRCRSAKIERIIFGFASTARNKSGS